MGLPARRVFPRVSVEPSVAVPHEAEPLEGGGGRAEAAFDLQTVVEAVFDPATDCVIYETGVSRTADRQSGRGLRVPDGCAIATMAASGRAIERLGRPRFLVAVGDARHWEQTRDVDWQQLTVLGQRCALIALASEGTVACQTRLTEAGWNVVDLRGSTTARAVAKALVATRYDQCSALVLVDGPAVLSAGPALPRQAALRLETSDSAAVLVRELLQRIDANRRYVPVLLVDKAPWRSLRRLDTVSANGDRELPQGLLAAAAAAHAGCHPVLIVDHEDVALIRANLSAILSAPEFGGTLVVVNCDPFHDVQEEWPDHVASYSVPADSGVEEIAWLLDRCLMSTGATVLSVPRGRVVPDAGANGSERPQSLTPGGLLSPQGIAFAVSAESAQSDQEEIARKQLRPDALRWVRAYDRVGHRNLYLWQWCLHGIELTTFPDVSDRQRCDLHDTKLLSVILCVLFDDVADRHGRTELLETLIHSAQDSGGLVPTVGRNDDSEYVTVTHRLWQEYESRVQRYPLYSTFERLWRFDLLQFLNTMRYAHLVNSQPGLLNLTEHDIYTPHNMLMVSFSTLDLMCVEHFRTSELGSLRESMWHAQAMGRIGNVLSTWRREQSESDRSSGMFIGDESLSVSTREHLLLEKWRWHRERCHASAAQVDSLNLDPVLRGHDRFFDMHLASAGRI